MEETWRQPAPMKLHSPHIFTLPSRSEPDVQEQVPYCSKYCIVKAEPPLSTKQGVLKNIWHVPE